MIKVHILLAVLVIVSQSAFAAGASHTKAKTATKKYDLRNASLFVNPKVWSDQKDRFIPEAPFELIHADSNAFVTAQSISQYLPAEEFLNNFFEGMKSSAADLVLLKKEERTVNGTPVLFYALKGTINNMLFVFNGYIYSNSKGSTTVYGYAHSNIFGELESDIAVALDGLVPTKKQ